MRNRVVSEETRVAIRAMQRIVQDAEGDPRQAREVAERLDGRAGTDAMDAFAGYLLKVMAELHNLQEERTTLLYAIDDFTRLHKDGLPLEGSDKTISLRIDGEDGDPSNGAPGTALWLELVDLEKPEAGRYAVYDSHRIDKAIETLTTAQRYGTPHEIGQAVSIAIDELTEQR